MSHSEEAAEPGRADSTASAPSPGPRIRIRIDSAADPLDAVSAGLELGASDAPPEKRAALDRALAAAVRSARRRRVALPLDEFLCEAKLDPLDRGIFLTLLPAAIATKDGVGFDLDALAKFTDRRTVGGLVELRTRLEETSRLRVPGVLESDADGDAEACFYRLSPPLARSLACAASAPVETPRTPPRPDELFADLVLAASLLSSVPARRERGEVVWSAPRPGGGWDRLGALRARLSRAIAALREAAAEPVGRVFAGTELGEAESRALALLVEGATSGRGELFAAVLAKLVLDTGDAADPNVLFGASGRLVSSGLVELPSGEAPLFFRTLTLTAAARERMSLPAAAAAKGAADDEEKEAALDVTSPSHRLADVVLAPAARTRVEEVLFRLGDGGALLRDWGVPSAAGGAAVLFYGAPGTGKTFTAGALAGELGRPLARLRIEGAHSKWVGDGEKRVAAAFRDAAAAGAVLLLDEADALVADRAGARSWQIPLVNLLLVEIERYPGLVVLATNYADALDPALERRLALRLEMLPPGEDERKELWRRYLPARAPLSADVDLVALARGHVLTGAGIRRACEKAALRAARRTDAARLISQADLVAAAAEGAPPVSRPLGFRTAPLPRPEPRKLVEAA